MSVKALTWAFEQPISATEKVVLLALADHANESGLCWPSIAVLVQRAHVGERTVQRALQSLEDGGFIARERRQRENGSDTSNLYRLMFDRVSQRVSGGVNLAPHGGVTQTGGEGVTGTGGEGVTQTVPRTVSKNHQKEPSDISADAEFDIFWAAYPKRPNNPKAPAKKKYLAARKRNVSHETIMAGVNAYAATRVNKDPEFTAQAVTWLNQERWATDFGSPADAGTAPQATDEQLEALLAAYSGHVGERDRAKQLLAAELAKGAAISTIIDAAYKYRLFCKGPPYEDRKITPVMLETWLRFKWREMDAYEFCTVGPDRVRTVRQKARAA
jgi:hypothetical protein